MKNIREFDEALAAYAKTCRETSTATQVGEAQDRVRTIFDLALLKASYFDPAFVRAVQLLAFLCRTEPKRLEGETLAALDSVEAHLIARGDSVRDEHGDLRSTAVRHSTVQDSFEHWAVKQALHIGRFKSAERTYRAVLTEWAWRGWSSRTQDGSVPEAVTDAQLEAAYRDYCGIGPDAECAPHYLRDFKRAVSAMLKAAQPEEPLKCDFCGAPTDDPWHASSETEKHLHQCDACHEKVPNNPAVAAIQFALEADEGLAWLRLWNEGSFDSCRREWPEAPAECYIGADPTLESKG